MNTPTLRLFDLGGCIHLAEVDPARPGRIVRFVRRSPRRLERVASADPRQTELKRRVCAARGGLSLPPSADR